MGFSLEGLDGGIWGLPVRFEELLRLLDWVLWWGRGLFGALSLSKLASVLDFLNLVQGKRNFSSYVYDLLKERSFSQHIMINDFYFLIYMTYILLLH